MLLDTCIYSSPYAPTQPEMAPVLTAAESQMSDQPKGELASEPNNGPKIGCKASGYLSGNKRGPETSQASSDYLSGNKRSPETSQELGVGVHARRRIRDPEDMVSNQQKWHREEPSALCANYHPDFHHNITPRGAGGLIFTPPPSAANPNDPRVSPQQERLEVAIQEQPIPIALTGRMTNFTFSNQKTHPSQPSKPPPSISNVAIRSLNETAKSVGITLEHLALVLSTTNKNCLMQVLSGDESTDVLFSYDRPVWK